VDHNTSLATLAALGVPISGEVTSLDRSAGRLTIETTRGGLTVEVDESLDGIDLGDVIWLEFPIGTGHS
jgi:hypothetical protein